MIKAFFANQPTTYTHSFDNPTFFLSTILFSETVWSYEEELIVNSMTNYVLPPISYEVFQHDQTNSVEK